MRYDPCNMLYLIQANTSIKVSGISGPFTRTVTWMVNANHHSEAKQKYEAQVKRDFAHMSFSEISFEYTMVAGEIK